MRAMQRVDALLGVVGHRQRLGVALRLVVDAARADRVDVAPVGLGLRVHLRVAVDLARRGDQEARALPLREAERVVRAVRADLQRRERRAQVVDRARERGEVEDEVDALVDPDRLDDVVVDERELVARGRARCSRASPVSRLSTQITRWPLLEQVVAEVRPEEAGAAGDDGGRHAAESYCAMRGLRRLVPYEPFSYRTGSFVVLPTGAADSPSVSSTLPDSRSSDHHEAADLILTGIAARGAGGGYGGARRDLTATATVSGTAGISLNLPADPSLTDTLDGTDQTVSYARFSASWTPAVGRRLEPPDLGDHLLGWRWPYAGARPVSAAARPARRAAPAPPRPTPGSPTR